MGNGELEEPPPWRSAGDQRWWHLAGKQTTSTAGLAGLQPHLTGLHTEQACPGIGAECSRVQQCVSTTAPHRRDESRQKNNLGSVNSTGCPGVSLTRIFQLWVSDAQAGWTLCDRNAVQQKWTKQVSPILPTWASTRWNDYNWRDSQQTATSLTVVDIPFCWTCSYPGQSCVKGVSALERLLWWWEQCWWATSSTTGTGDNNLQFRVTNKQCGEGEGERKGGLWVGRWPSRAEPESLSIIWWVLNYHCEFFTWVMHI